MSFVLHYFLHLGLPLLIAVVFFRRDWKKAYVILLATMLVDLDHLLATPIYQADRCSIGFHPLHSIYAIVVYAAMLLLPSWWKVVGVGLLWHMTVDGLDCLMM